MEIVYFKRNKVLGFSIEKVFIPVIHELAKKNSVREFNLPYYKFSLLCIIKNLLFVYKKRSRFGINHITGDIHYAIFALVGCKSVLTIHDLVMLKNTKNRIFYWIEYLFNVYFPVKLATQVVCISEATKEDLLKYVKCKNIIVVNNPIGYEFKPSPQARINTKPVLLQIGTGWNKNLTLLIEALKQKDCILYIVGDLSSENKLKLFDCKINYRNFTDLSDEEVVEIYKVSDIVCFVSIFEGFGMPVIEANAIGRAVITSNISPLTEIGGTAALYVDPYDVDSISRGIDTLLHDFQRNFDLINNGFDNVKKYNPTIISSKYQSVYDSLYIL